MDELQANDQVIMRLCLSRRETLRRRLALVMAPSPEDQRYASEQSFAGFYYMPTAENHERARPILAQLAANEQLRLSIKRRMNAKHLLANLQAVNRGC